MTKELNVENVAAELLSLTQNGLDMDSAAVRVLNSYCPRCEYLSASDDFCNPHVAFIAEDKSEVVKIDVEFPSGMKDLAMMRAYAEAIVTLLVALRLKGVPSKAEKLLPILKAELRRLTDNQHESKRVVVYAIRSASGLKGISVEQDGEGLHVRYRCGESELKRTLSAYRVKEALDYFGNVYPMSDAVDLAAEQVALFLRAFIMDVWQLQADMNIVSAAKAAALKKYSSSGVVQSAVRTSP